MPDGWEERWSNWLTWLKEESEKDAKGGIQSKECEVPDLKEWKHGCYE
jgi:hypothetical protein